MFWERFTELCLELNTKPTPTAKEIGISPAVLTKWKNGISYPSGEMLIKMADYFNCTVDYLIGRSDLKNYDCKFSSEDISLLRKIHLLDEKDYSEILYILDFKVQNYPKRKEKYPISQQDKLA